MLPNKVIIQYVDCKKAGSAIIESFQSSPKIGISLLEKHVAPAFEATMSCKDPEYFVTFIARWPHMGVILRVPQTRRSDYDLLSSFLGEAVTSSSKSEWCKVYRGRVATQTLPNNRRHPFQFVEKMLAHYFPDLDKHIVVIERYKPDGGSAQGEEETASS